MSRPNGVPVGPLAPNVSVARNRHGGSCGLSGTLPPRDEKISDRPFVPRRAGVRVRGSVVVLRPRTGPVETLGYVWRGPLVLPPSFLSC